MANPNDPFEEYHDKLGPFDAIIEEPMLTEEGFENPNFMPALLAALDSIPETYERLAGDPEWNTPRLTHYRHIVGALAMWAVRNLDDDANDVPYHPEGLEQVVGYVAAVLKPQFDGDGCSPMKGFKEVSLCEINKMLHVMLNDEKFAPFQEWDKWLDLSALLHNVCLTIRDERRQWDEFERKFEEEWAKNPNNPENQNEGSE